MNTQQPLQITEFTLHALHTSRSNKGNSIITTTNVAENVQ